MEKYGVGALGAPKVGKYHPWKMLGEDPREASFTTLTASNENLCTRPCVGAGGTVGRGVPVCVKLDVSVCVEETVRVCEGVAEGVRVCEGVAEGVGVEEMGVGEGDDDGSGFWPEKAVISSALRARL